MFNLHNLLVEHAMFPFPQVSKDLSSDGTDISLVAVPLLEWGTLENILGDTLLPADAENQLLLRFFPCIQFHLDGFEMREWRRNPNESHTRMLLDEGVFEAVWDFLRLHGQYKFNSKLNQVVDRGNSMVDYFLEVDGEAVGLLEAEPPSVMNNLRGSLPQHGIELTWARDQPMAPKILTKGALHLGLRRMEWLFSTSHNHWMVCRLARDDHHPFLAYSPMISIDESSVPFRALLCAILSVIKNVPVQPTEFNPNMKLDIVVEEDKGGDIDNSLVYPGEEIAKDYPITRSRHRTGQRKAESELMMTSSSQNSPESSQIWIHLHRFSNNMPSLPQCATNGKQRLWLTRFVGSGSTGDAWQCHFDGGVDRFVAKIAEVLRYTDTDKQQRLHDEFNIYLILEKAYQSHQPHNHIAPRCYGAFEGRGVAVLILDLCDSVLKDWGELSDPERSQVYKLVRDLHRIGISHEDLEPRNIARVREGGFCLIDFSESRRHRCQGSKICSELRAYKNRLWIQPFKMSIRSGSVDGVASLIDNQIHFINDIQQM